MTISLHETCLEYFRRRLSEGWKCISLEGYNAVLLSPDGIRRDIDLRNDVETLRPNASGSETGIASQFPISGAHWDKVDEEVADGTSTYLYTTSLSYQRDLFNIVNHSIGSGIINFIKVYVSIKEYATPAGATHKIAIKTGGTVYEGAEITVTNSFALYSEQWNTNPQAGGAWTWAQIDDLQIGVAMRKEADTAYCTQAYVEVDYVPAVGIQNKSANMAAKMMARGLI